METPINLKRADWAQAQAQKQQVKPQQQRSNWQGPAALAGSAVAAFALPIVTPKIVPPPQPQPVQIPIAFREAIREFQPVIPVAKPEPINVYVQQPAPAPQPSVNEIASEVAQQLEVKQDQKFQQIQDQIAQQQQQAQQSNFNYSDYVPRESSQSSNQQEWEDYFSRMSPQQFHQWKYSGSTCPIAWDVYHSMGG